jgi:tetratricopeptide (TPR) repeat protein
MGWIYFKLERYEKALGPLKEAAENLATDPSVRYHYGLALLKTGDRGNAKKNLKAALQLSETFPGAEEATRAGVTGDPASVLLWLWGRRSDDAVTFTGDEKVLAEFRARLAESTD